MAVLIRELETSPRNGIPEKNALTSPTFYWQDGYGAFSVRLGTRRAYDQYIANQEEHHRRETFQDEFRRALRKYGLEWDERYVWD